MIRNNKIITKKMKDTWNTNNNFKIKASAKNSLQIVKYSTTPLKGGGTSKDLSIISVKFYENADAQKLQILADNKGKSGVYLWKNKKNGKLYVGSSQDLARRLKSYYNINHLIKESSMVINRALLKNE